MSGKGWKRLGGVACLIAAWVVYASAQRASQQNFERTQFVATRLVQAMKWEDEIGKMKTRIADDSQKLAGDMGNPADEKAAQTQVGWDKENLAAFEKMENAMGTVAVQRQELEKAEGHRWVAWGERAGSGLLLILGIGLLAWSFMGSAIRSEG